MEEKRVNVWYKPSQRERLARFAMSHFLISILGCFLAMAIGFLLFVLAAQSDMLMYIVLVALSTAGLASYWAAGVHSAGTYRWCRPQSVMEALLAFLFPALIAWAWGSLMLFCMSLSGRGAYDLFSGLLMVNFFAALPSLIMVVTSLVLGFLDGGLSNLIVCMLFVGGLPPLMFLLGGIWGGRKAEQRVARVCEETEGADGTQ